MLLKNPSEWPSETWRRRLQRSQLQVFYFSECMEWSQSRSGRVRADEDFSKDLNCKLSTSVSVCSGLEMAQEKLS